MDTKHAEAVGYRKVGIALTVALSCFLLYVLACVFSSPAWSPDSSKIALLVMSGDVEDPEQFAIFAYDIHTEEHVLLDQVDANGVLCNPAWSPDGKWIAYYRLRHSLSEAPGAEPNQPAQPGPATGQPAEAADAAKLFSEGNKMLPPFAFDALKAWIEKEGGETLPMELVAVTPDGKDRKILRTLQYPVLSENDLTTLALLQPGWSRDSQRLFYPRPVTDTFYYLAGLDLATGQTQAHLCSANGTFALSPDGNWIASCLGLEDDSEPVVLSVAKTDGSAQRYFRLDAEKSSGDETGFLAARPSWSPDGEQILVPLKELCVVEATTGRMRKYRDPETDEIMFGIFSPSSERLYYLATVKSTDPNAGEEKVTLRTCNLENGKTQTVFTVSDVPAFGNIGRFSISPDGKMVALWCLVGRAGEEEEPVLLLWDGKSRKLIQTSAWLPKSAKSAAQKESKP